MNLKKLEPRTAKANLKLVLEAYNREGLDLYGVINVNETAAKVTFKTLFRGKMCTLCEAKIQLVIILLP